MHVEKNSRQFDDEKNSVVHENLLEVKATDIHLFYFEDAKSGENIMLNVV